MSELAATASADRQMVPEVIRRVVERLLPWYDPELEAQRDAHTEAIRQRSIRARIAAEAIRDRYERFDRVIRP